MMSRCHDLSKAEAEKAYRRAVLISAVVITIALLVGVSLAINGAFTPSKGSEAPSAMALTLAEMPSGWAVLSPYSQGYQGSFIGNVVDSGGMSFLRSGAVQETVVFNLWRYNNSAEAAYAYAVMIDLIHGRSIPIKVLVMADRAMLLERNDSSGAGKELIFLKGHTLVFVIYNISSGTAEEAQVTALAQLQLSKMT